MKKLFIVLVSILFIAGSFVIPVMARSVFEVEIIPCGAAGTSDGCGINTAATDPLLEGDVDVDEDGEVEVKLKGTLPNATYIVFVGNWVTSNNFQIQFVGTGTDCGNGNISIGTVTTDNFGAFEGPITTASGANFAFPTGTTIGQPNFAFNNQAQACSKTQFTTGFRTP